MQHTRALVIDDFCPSALQLRSQALAANFIDWPGPDGEVYKRICIVDLPEIRQAIERHMGPVSMYGMAYRLNFDGEMPNAAIHSDLGWGTHALVLYLCDGPGGTAFWRHKQTQLESIKPGQFDQWHAVRDDWNNAEAWEQTELARLRFNRGVIYDGSHFHSRWPFEAFGHDATTGRLILVAFFTPAWATQP